MKSVLISIQPKWCELIASGKKTVEVRKTKPKLETPFKCYIYCTKGKDLLTSVNGKVQKPNNTVIDLSRDSKINVLNGSVIGEFVCNSISGGSGEYAVYHAEGTCLTSTEIADYIEDKYAYFWHISDLVIYDEPKELGEFERACPDNVRSCAMCRHSGYSGMKCSKQIKPPQSWCYVEERSNR